MSSLSRITQKRLKNRRVHTVWCIQPAGGVLKMRSSHVLTLTLGCRRLAPCGGCGLCSMDTAHGSRACLWPDPSGKKELHCCGETGAASLEGPDRKIVKVDGENGRLHGEVRHLSRRWVKTATLPHRCQDNSPLTLDEDLRASRASGGQSGEQSNCLLLG